MIQYVNYRNAAVLTLDAPPVNAISFAVLDELLEAVRKATADAAVGRIVITGGPEHFSAGADLAIFRSICGDADAVRLSRVFQEAFQTIADCPKPVIAAVAGNVLGGALELAMACHARVAAEGSRFSMPEVNLGINPGAGGTQRLPRLVGLDAALDMLLGGRPIDARRAQELGLIDAVCAGEDLLEAAVRVQGSGFRVQGSVPSTQYSVPSTQYSVLSDPLPVENEARQAIFVRAEERIASGRPELLAPRGILEAVRTGVEQSFAAGLRCEQEVFCRCMATHETQNKIYIFCASRQTARVPELQSVAAMRIEEAGVLGMGTMGGGIAQALVAAGLRVTACDERDAALQAGTARIRTSLDRRVSQGKLSAAKGEAALARLRCTLDLSSLATAQLVVEAVFEEVAVKRAAIARLEEICPPATIIATNTSTINLDVLADGMRHPERLVGLHFFHPAQQMPLVEVVRRRATPPEVVATAMALAKSIGKTPVLVENREGFVVNRLFIPYLMEAFWILEEGADPAEIDRAMVDFGFAMGPLQLIDMSGLDILDKTHAIMRQAFPHHGDLAPLARELVAKGHLGQKTGAGVYRYEPGDRTPWPHELTEQAVARARKRRPLDPRGIAERLMLRMVAEAFCLVEERVVRQPADVDVAMVLGTGLADFRGGVLKYACNLGLDRVLGDLRRLSEEHGPRYTPCRLLEEAAGNPRKLNL